LKFLLQQKLHSHFQENRATNGLSRCFEGASTTITSIIPDRYQEVTTSYEKGGWTKELLEQLILNPNSRQGFTLSNGLMRYKGRLVIGDREILRGKILDSLHGSLVGGHSGMQNTYHRVKQLFYWP